MQNEIVQMKVDAGKSSFRVVRVRSRNKVQWNGVVRSSIIQLNEIVWSISGDLEQTKL